VLDLDAKQQQWSRCELGAPITPYGRGFCFFRDTDKLCFFGGRPLDDSVIKRTQQKGGETSANSLP
jgi:hypothetical protein